MSTRAARDHGGGIDAAIARWGGARRDWIDLSTGINPQPYPFTFPGAECWSRLPDAHATEALLGTARQFWRVPDSVAMLAAPGASALIARLPALLPVGSVQVRPDTYNEHAAAFRAAGWAVSAAAGDVRVVVNPNNPDGTFWDGDDEDWGRRALVVIDESFCDTDPQRSLVQRAGPGILVLKSFGKFWGLAGLRLGFAIGDPAVIARLAELLGPWAVPGPALAIGKEALADTGWAEATRARLFADAARLDALLATQGVEATGECPLFRLCTVDDAAAWQDRLASRHILSRVFPYSRTWLRLGLPGPGDWDRLGAAL